MSESITYTISNTDRTNDKNGFVSEYYVDFGGFGDYYSKYKCEIVRFTVSGNVDVSLGYVILNADNLHSGGFHSNRPSSEITLCAVDTNVLLTTTRGSTFVVPNCQSKRRVRFFLTDSQFAPLVSWQLLDAQDTGSLNRNGIETDWLLSLKLTPIKE